MSSRRRPSNGARAVASRPNRASACSRMKSSRTGLNWCSGPNLPFGSHHSAAMRGKAGDLVRIDAGGGRSAMRRVAEPRAGARSTDQARHLLNAAAVARRRRLAGAPDPLSRLVMKFGGTSVADLERIRRVARLVAAEVDAGIQGRGRGLGHGRARPTSWSPGPTAPAPPAQGVEAVRRRIRRGRGVGRAGDGRPLGHGPAQHGLSRPLLAGLAGADRSPTACTAARASTRCRRRGCWRRLTGGEIAVIAGFQGVDARWAASRRWAAAARDTSAVAVAAAIGAGRCDIYTDVDGVYTTDPRIESARPQAAAHLLRRDA